LGHRLLFDEAERATRKRRMPRPAFTVVVVEDDPSMRRSMSRSLGAHGFATETFDSAEAFLDRLPLNGPVCLVLDIQLEGMSGPQLRDHLWAKGLNLPVIFITGIGENDVEQLAASPGCVAFLRKPFAAELLIEAVNKAVSGMKLS